MSWRRKTAMVLRLLPGEDLETVSRSLSVAAVTLTSWREAFLSAGLAALASRPETGEALENDRLKAKLAEVMIERELLYESARPLHHFQGWNVDHASCSAERTARLRLPLDKSRGQRHRA